MMHKWESTEKLLTEWEQQEVPQNFEFQRFAFERDEFDNVPPVVPRFLFYIQLVMHPMLDKLKEISQIQTTVQLREEIMAKFDQFESLLNEKESKLKADDASIMAKVDGL